MPHVASHRFIVNNAVSMSELSLQACGRTQWSLNADPEVTRRLHVCALSRPDDQYLAGKGELDMVLQIQIMTGLLVVNARGTITQCKSGSKSTLILPD
jgi:hypothetical protein